MYVYNLKIPFSMYVYSTMLLCLNLTSQIYHSLIFAMEWLNRHAEPYPAENANESSWSYFEAQSIPTFTMKAYFDDDKYIRQMVITQSFLRIADSENRRNGISFQTVVGEGIKRCLQVQFLVGIRPSVVFIHQQPFIRRNTALSYIWEQLILSKASTKPHFRLSHGK